MDYVYIYSKFTIKKKSNEKKKLINLIKLIHIHPSIYLYISIYFYIYTNTHISYLILGLLFFFFDDYKLYNWLAQHNTIHTQD